MMMADILAEHWVVTAWHNLTDVLTALAAAVAAVALIYRAVIRPILKRIDRWLDTREELAKLPARFDMHQIEADRRDELIARLQTIIDEHWPHTPGGDSY